jgi:hypothetical protein
VRANRNGLSCQQTQVMPLVLAALPHASIEQSSLSIKRSRTMLTSMEACRIVCARSGAYDLWFVYGLEPKVICLSGPNVIEQLVRSRADCARAGLVRPLREHAGPRDEAAEDVRLAAVAVVGDNKAVRECVGHLLVRRELLFWRLAVVHHVLEPAARELQPQGVSLLGASPVGKMRNISFVAADAHGLPTNLPVAGCARNMPQLSDTTASTTTHNEPRRVYAGSRFVAQVVHAPKH